MTMTAERVDRPGGADVVAQLKANDALDELFDRIDSGVIELTVPKDRDGSFAPQLVPKGSRRLSGLDEMIISLYTGGMTIRDIQHHLTDTIRDFLAEIAPETGYLSED